MAFRVITSDSHNFPSSLVILLLLCIDFFFHCQLSKTIMFKDFQLQQEQKSVINSASYSFKNITEHGKKSPVEDEEIIISTRPAIGRSLSPIGRNIYISQTNRFIERKSGFNWQSRGQHDSSYYQPQPDTYN